MTSKPKALVVTGDGINCDAETEWGLNLAGFDSRRIHTFDLLKNPRLLNEVEMLAIPGGFSFGDEIASGKVLAVKLKERFQETLYSFVDQGKLVIGICNGFQVLVQLGLLPKSGAGDKRVVSLLRNSHGHFLNRWVKMNVSAERNSRFLQGITEIELPIRHGEGRLALESGLNGGSAESALVKDLGVLRYAEDVNGSFDRIAALVNEDDTVFGIMPHPEAFVRWTQHPNWTALQRTGAQSKRSAPAGNGSESAGQPDGLAILANAARSLTGERKIARPKAQQPDKESDSSAASRPTTYAEAGVDVKKGERFVDRLKNYARRDGHDRLWKGAGGYAAIVPITDNEAVALTTDGVGTKLLLALEANDLSTIGLDLVAMCANDLICVGARPKSFLDYYATGELEDDLADSLIMGITRGCDLAQMLLVGGETAELPDLYQHRHFDIAGFAMGTVTRPTLITGAAIAPGDALIGVASSGIHSNGLSLARKLIPAGHDLRSQLLTPTHIYVRPVDKLFDMPRVKLKGIVHVTGGGWRNLFRVNSQVGFNIDDPLPELPIFEELARSVDIEELYKTFNMGMGLALICPEQNIADVIEAFRASGFAAKRIGTVTAEAQSMKIARPEKNGTVRHITLRH